MTIASKAIYLTVLFMMINVSAALTMQLVKGPDGELFFADTPMNYDFDTNTQVIFKFNETTNELGEAVQSSGQLEDKGNQVYRVLDVMGLGFIMRIYDFITDYMYGIVNMFEAIFGPLLDKYDTTLRPMIFGTMRWAMFFLYVIAFVSIVANKRIAEDYGK